VKLSVRSDYAARAVLGLARRVYSRAPVTVEELASEQGIPPNYLVQILIDLKSKQIVRSVRGKSGGYLLARPPAEITFGDVLRCVHGQIFDTPALSDKNCAPQLRRAWMRLRESIETAADGINFQQLAEESAENLYYI
jgi:Rrf2 family transcriptional regulator, cysteine metabolism repressor